MSTSPSPSRAPAEAPSPSESSDPIGIGRFIVGMPRSATTWLAKCLNVHSDVVAFGETLFWGRYYVEPSADGRYSPDQVREIRQRLMTGDCLESVEGEGPGCLRSLTRETLPSVLEPEFDALPERPTPREVFDALARAVSRGEGKPVVVEKTPHHLNWLDRLTSHYQNARFAVMLREPYGFMLSYKHQGDRMDDAARANFQRLYHPIGCALVWRRYMEAALVARDRLPEQVMFVRFEDVIRDPSHVLGEVQSFYQLPQEDIAGEVPADNTSFPGDQRPRLGPEDIFWMNLIGGKVLVRSGFTLQRASFSPLAVLFSALRLPIWAVLNLLRFRKIVKGSLISYLWRWIRPSRSSPPSLSSNR